MTASEPRRAGVEQLAPVHRRPRPAGRDLRLPRRRAPATATTRSARSWSPSGGTEGAARRRARSRRPRRRGHAHRPHLRGDRQPRPPGGRRAALRAVPSVWTASGGSTATRSPPRSAAKTRAMLLMSPSMPSGGVLTDEPTGTPSATSADEHDCRCSTTRRWSGCCSTGGRSLHPLRFEPGMAERTVIVGSLSKEHRMIGWRVGWVAGPAATSRTSAGCTSTTRPCRPRCRELPGGRGAARRPGPRGRSASPSSSAAATCSLDALPGWPFVRPAGGWSLLLDVVVARHRRRPRLRGCCSRSPRSPPRRCRLGRRVAAAHVRWCLQRRAARPPANDPRARGRHEAGRSRRPAGVVVLPPR